MYPNRRKADPIPGRQVKGKGSKGLTGEKISSNEMVRKE